MASFFSSSDSMSFRRGAWLTPVSKSFAGGSSSGIPARISCLNVWFTDIEMCWTKVFYREIIANCEHVSGMRQVKTAELSDLRGFDKYMANCFADSGVAVDRHEETSLYDRS